MTTIRSDYAALARTDAVDALARAPKTQHARRPEAFADFQAFDVSDDVRIHLPGPGHHTADVGHAARQIVMHLVDD